MSAVLVVTTVLCLSNTDVSDARVHLEATEARSQHLMLAQDLPPPPPPPLISSDPVYGNQGLQARLLELEDSRPSLVGPIIMLSIGAVLTLAGVPLTLIGVALVGYGIGLAFLLGALVAFGVGIPLLVIGIVQVSKRSRELHTIDREIRQIRARLGPGERSGFEDAAEPGVLLATF